MFFFCPNMGRSQTSLTFHQAPHTFKLALGECLYPTITCVGFLLALQVCICHRHFHIFRKGLHVQSDSDCVRPQASSTSVKLSHQPARVKALSCGLMVSSYGVTSPLWPEPLPGSEIPSNPEDCTEPLVPLSILHTMEE